jgi:hypothetical protein
LRLLNSLEIRIEAQTSVSSVKEHNGILISDTVDRQILPKTCPLHAVRPCGDPILWKSEIPCWRVWAKAISSRPQFNESILDRRQSDTERLALNAKISVEPSARRPEFFCNARVSRDNLNQSPPEATGVLCPPGTRRFRAFLLRRKERDGADAQRSALIHSLVLAIFTPSQSSTVAKLLSRGPPALGRHAFVFGVTDQRFDDVLSEVNRLFPSQGQQAIKLLELLEKLFRTSWQKRDQVRAAIRAVRKDALECLRAFLTGAPRPGTVPVVRHVRNLCQGVWLSRQQAVAGVTAPATFFVRGSRCSIGFANRVESAAAGRQARTA